MTQINKTYNRVTARSANITGTLELDGTALTGTAASLNTVTAQPAGVDFTIGDETSNAITVNLQVNDADGNALSSRAALLFYLSSSATGDNSATAATSLVAGTDGHIIEYVSNSAGVVVTEVDGDADLVIGDASGAATYYVVVVLPNGSLVVSDAVTFAA